MATAYAVMEVTNARGTGVHLYTLNRTHYGQLLFVFRFPGDELNSFREYAQATLRGHNIRPLILVADDLEQIQRELDVRQLLPSGRNRFALEGTEFYDECMAQLSVNAIWA